MKPDIKKLIVLNIPYVIVWYLADKIGWLYRMVPGDMAAYKIANVFMNFTAAFQNLLPSFHPIDKHMRQRGFLWEASLHNPKEGGRRDCLIYLKRSKKRYGNF